MGLMDILGGLLGKKTPRSGNSILDALLPMLLKGGALGGLVGLLNKFRGAGLGDKAASWVGTGPNQALDASEVHSALGPDTIAHVANQAGVSTEEAAGGLASMLPNLINGLTPNGELPTGGLGKLLKGFDFSSLLAGLGK